jgi:hypothetical protein
LYKRKVLQYVPSGAFHGFPRYIDGKWKRARTNDQCIYTL